MAYKQGGGSGGGAPTDATYIVQTANGTLTQERVATDTATVAWDFATPGQAKLNVVPAYLTANQTITLSGDASGSGTTSIAVTLATVPVGKGGTGATSFTAGRLLIGNGSSAITTDADLTFDTGTNKLTIGGDLQIGASAIIERGSTVLFRAGGTNNLFFGQPAGGGSIGLGSNNISFGADALQNIVGGNGNIGIGKLALRDNANGTGNTAIGADTMVAGTGPNSNTAIGSGAGYKLAGTNNEAIGVNAMSNADNSGLFGNTAIGSSSLNGITTSGVSYNVGIGFQAGDAITTGSQNTLVGASADVSAGGAANRTAIGYNVSADTDNQVFLGNSSVTAWVPGASNTADLGRSDRAFKVLYLNGSDVRAGTGSPEGVVTAPVGSLFLRSDGGSGTALYRKESGTGNTGWVATSGGGGGLGYSLTVYTLSQATLTDAQTIYWGGVIQAPTTTAALRRTYIPKAGTIKACYVWMNAATAGTGESWDCNIRLNNTTDTLVQSLASTAGYRVWSNTSLSIAVVAGDYFEFKMVNPTWATNPATVQFGASVYIE